MRFLIFLLLALAIIEPTRWVFETPRILLVTDNSESTLREDGARCDVDLLAKNLAHAALVETVSLRDFSAYGSPLGDFLSHLLAARNASSSQMICFISDGIVTRGAKLEEVKSSIPIVGIAVGNDAPLPRISWGIPHVIQTENAWKVAVSLNGHALRAPLELTLCVREKIAEKPFDEFPIFATETLTLDEKIYWAIEIPRDDNDKLTQREFIFSFSLQNFDRDFNSARVAIVPPTTLTVSLSQNSPRVRALLIENSPRAEYRFLRETLRRIDECELTTLLFDADKNSDPLGFFTSADARLDAQSLEMWDLILLGDVELADLPAAFLAKPLIFLVGTQNTDSFFRAAGDFAFAAESLDENHSQENDNEELIFADDPLIPPRPNEKPFSLRWSAPLKHDVANSYSALRVLASANGNPVIAIDESRRWCWHGTDEFYRVIGVWGDSWYREYWRNLIFLLGNSAQHDFSRNELNSEFDTATLEEFKRTARDTNALRKISESSGGFFFDAQINSEEKSKEKLEEKIASAILAHFANTPHTTRTAIFSRWIIFAAIISLFVLIWRKK